MKICGITSEEDALLAVAMGADALGFHFGPSSWQVAPRVVHDIVRRLPPEVIPIGVFRNHAKERVVEIVNAAGLKGAQLCGPASPEDTRWVRRRLPMVIATFGLGDPMLGEADAFGADIVMVDAPSLGTGQVFDWRLTEGVPAGVRLMLGGGLDPENVADAIAQVNPWGVDVASGVEGTPGRKDPRKLRAFVNAAHAAAKPPYEEVDSGPYDWQEEP